jgi:hypothetical protein
LQEFDRRPLVEQARARLLVLVDVVVRVQPFERTLDVVPLAQPPVHFDVRGEKFAPRGAESVVIDVGDLGEPARRADA